MPDAAAGGGAEGEAVGLPPRPGKGSGLRPVERTSDLDSMPEATETQKKKNAIT